MTSPLPSRSGVDEPGSPDDDDRESRADEDEMAEWVQPEKAMRIGLMVKELLSEVRNTPLDLASRHRLRKIYEVSLDEVSSALSSELAAELGRMMSPFDHPAPRSPSCASPRHNWSGGSRGYSTVSRRPSSRSSWPPERNSSGCVDKSLRRDRLPIPKPHARGSIRSAPAYQ